VVELYVHQERGPVQWRGVTVCSGGLTHVVVVAVMCGLARLGPLGGLHRVRQVDLAVVDSGYGARHSYDSWGGSGGASW
jgi:hypothetical protein